jgi:hypothetical protein
MNTMKVRRMALGIGALAVLCTLPGCIVEPFGGRGGGEERGEHGERRSRENYVPAPDFLPSKDAGDSGEFENVGLRAGHPPQTDLAPNFTRSAVYLPPLAQPRAIGLWG